MTWFYTVIMIYIYWLCIVTIQSWVSDSILVDTALIGLRMTTIKLCNWYEGRDLTY